MVSYMRIPGNIGGDSKGFPFKNVTNETNNRLRSIGIATSYLGSVEHYNLYVIPHTKYRILFYLRGVCFADSSFITWFGSNTNNSKLFYASGEVGK